MESFNYHKKEFQTVKNYKPLKFVIFLKTVHKSPKFDKIRFLQQLPTRNFIWFTKK